MDAVLPFVAVWFAWSILAGFAYWLRAGPFRKLAVTSMLFTSCSLVFWVWDHSAWLRGLAVIPVILMLGKSWIVAARRTSWLPDSPTPGQFVLWCLALPEGRFVAEVEARQALRRSAALEAVRGAGKILICLLLFAINEHAELYTHRPVQLLWTAVVFYLLFSSIRDVLGAVWGAMGVEISAVFDAPLIARNPRDFWGMRWNLWFTQTAHRLVFVPVRERSSALWASTVVFGLSALVHEAIVMAGRATFDGRMLLFFAVQGLGATVYTLVKARGVRPWPRALAVCAHFGWMWLTVAWFLDPLDTFFGISRWGLSDILSVFASST